jgi:hypothetical protein
MKMMSTRVLEEMTPEQVAQVASWPIELPHAWLGLSLGVRRPGESFPERVVYRYPHVPQRGPDMEWRVPWHRASDRELRHRLARDLHRLTELALPECLAAVNDSGGECWDALVGAIVLCRQRRSRG